MNSIKTGRPDVFADYLVQCQEGFDTLTEDKVANLLGKPGWVAAPSQTLQRLAHQVETLAPTHADLDSLHQAASAIATELRLIAAGGRHG